VREISRVPKNMRRKNSWNILVMQKLEPKDMGQSLIIINKIQDLFNFILLWKWFYFQQALKFSLYGGVYAKRGVSEAEKTSWKWCMF
jgi:hypothetical protein